MAMKRRLDPISVAVWLAFIGGNLLFWAAAGSFVVSHFIRF
jgi:hypothetical protein